jgi:hypothetical protein
MKISLTFTCSSNNIIEKCRPLRREVLDLVSSATAAKDYGTSLDLLLVNGVFQHIEWLKLGSKLSRKNKDIRVDVPLGGVGMGRQRFGPENCSGEMSDSGCGGR